MQNNLDKQFFDELCGQDISTVEILEAKQNLLGFFNVLYKIDQRLKQQQSNVKAPELTL